MLLYLNIPLPPLVLCLTAFDRYSLHKHWYSATTRKASPPTWRRQPPGVATATTTPYVIDSSSRRPPTHSATSPDPPIVLRTAGRWPSRAAARRRCDNDAVACRCDGAGAAARRADGRSLLAAPPMAPRQQLRRVSHDAAARPPRRSLIVTRSRRRARTPGDSAARRLRCRPGPRAATDVIGDVIPRRRSSARWLPHRAMLLTSSATSLRVAVRPRTAALAAPLLVRAALPAPRQLRHYASPPRWRRGMTSSATSFCVAAAAPLHTAER